MKKIFVFIVLSTSFGLFCQDVMSQRQRCLENLYKRLCKRRELPHNSQLVGYELLQCVIQPLPHDQDIADIELNQLLKEYRELFKEIQQIGSESDVNHSKMEAYIDILYQTLVSIEQMQEHLLESNSIDACRQLYACGFSPNEIRIKKEAVSLFSSLAKAEQCPTFFTSVVIDTIETRQVPDQDAVDLVWQIFINEPSAGTAVLDAFILSKRLKEGSQLQRQQQVLQKFAKPPFKDDMQRAARELLKHFQHEKRLISLIKVAHAS